MEMRLIHGPLVFLVLLLAGCKTGTLPDPNDPNEGVVQAMVLRNKLIGANEMLMRRKAAGEISEAEYRMYILKAANQILDLVEVAQVEPQRAWEYAEVCIAAQRWELAEDYLRVAVRVAPNEDRRVNDRLRLARVLAVQGEVREAVQMARSTYDARPTDKAPILTAVLLEIVPAGRGKGQDAALAKLLEDAIEQAKQTVVDPNSEAGALFLAARGFHVNNAWQTIIDLYRAAGLPVQAEAASKRALGDMATRANT